MYSALIAIHLIVSIVMILVVIFQSGKGSEMGAVFGGGASQTAFGSQGAAGFLEKTTVVCAVIFMLTSLSLAVLSSNRQKSLIGDVTPPPVEQSVPQSAPVEAPAQSKSQPMQAPAAPQSGSVPQPSAPATPAAPPAAPAN